jgi:hypothetical protein
MRAANDEKLKEIEKKGSADPLLVARVEKANADVTALSDRARRGARRAAREETINARLTAGSRSDVRDADVQNARRFFSLTRGKPVVNVTNDDLKEYQAYRNAFAQYLRRGDQALAIVTSAALSTGAAPTGGFWLTPDTSGKIVEFLEDLSSMRKLASVSPIGTDTFEGNYDLDEASSGWVGETMRAPRRTRRGSTGSTASRSSSSMRAEDDAEDARRQRERCRAVAREEGRPEAGEDREHGLRHRQRHQLPEGVHDLLARHAGAHVGRGLSQDPSAGPACRAVSRREPGRQVHRLIQAIPSALRSARCSR